MTQAVFKGEHQIGNGGTCEILDWTTPELTWLPPFISNVSLPPLRIHHPEASLTPPLSTETGARG